VAMGTGAAAMAVTARTITHQPDMLTARAITRPALMHKCLTHRGQSSFNQPRRHRKTDREQTTRRQILTPITTLTTITIPESATRVTMPLLEPRITCLRVIPQGPLTPIQQPPITTTHQVTPTMGTHQVGTAVTTIRQAITTPRGADFDIASTSVADF